METSGVADDLIDEVFDGVFHEVISDVVDAFIKPVLNSGLSLITDWPGRQGAGRLRPDASTPRIIAPG